FYVDHPFGKGTEWKDGCACGMAHQVIAVAAESTLRQRLYELAGSKVLSHIGALRYRDAQPFSRGLQAQHRIGQGKKTRVVRRGETDRLQPAIPAIRRDH